MRELNDQIDVLKSDSAKLQEYYRPVTAFLTFENEEGLNRCQNYNNAVFEDEQFKEYRTLLSHPL